jgi:EAL domain-containing protein (putative c-di-GMP-specific phosphodiesterase class I)
MDEKAHARLRMGSELRHALDAGQLSLYFQPVVDLADGHIVKAEALLRWDNPLLGKVDPSEFIPVAEESGLMGRIGNWVFREAALCSKRWSQSLGAQFQVGINKSPVQFVPRDLESDWLQYLRELDLPGDNIVIEITEGLLLHASPYVTNKLLEYRDAGIQVAIDDFGTGYSSMAYLNKFHIDFLKIDQSFVRDIATDPGSRTIAETIIVMAHKLGLKVIAEGIETQEQMEFLIHAGCDYGQGFFFSHPLPAEQMDDMLSRDAFRWHA